MSIKVYHKNQDINWRIPKDSFPDIERAFKGSGYYEFEASPLSFKINRNGLILSINDKIQITDSTGMNILAFIDSIDDETSNPVEVTVFPQSLKLKDIMAGEEVVINENPENEETAIDFDTAGFMSVRDIVAKLAAQASSETKFDYRTNETAIPDPDTNYRRFFGNDLLEIVRGKLRIMDDSMHFRGKDGILYLIKKDSGFVWSTLATKGQWAEKQLNAPGRDVNLGVTSITKGAWLSYDLSLPPFDIKIPGIGAYYDVYRCEYGEITYIDRYVGAANEENDLALMKMLENTYGEKVSTLQYDNIESESSISSMVSEMGYNLSEVYAVIDTDPFNSYALVKCHKKKNDFFGRDMLLSFETSTDFYYQAHYRNKSIMDILKDFAVVTDRYLLIDSENTIHLLPRDTSLGSIVIPRGKILDIKKKSSNVEEITVNVNRYIENENGEPSSYGIKLRDNEWSSRESDIKSKFTGTETEYTIDVLGRIAGLDLGMEPIINGDSYGIVIKMKYSRTDGITEIVTEVYNV